MKILFRLIVVILLHAWPTVAGDNLSQLSPIHYTIDLDLDLTRSGYDITENGLTGTATIDLKNHSGNPASHIDFMLHRLIQVDKIEMVSNETDATPLKFTQSVKSMKGWQTYQVNAIRADLTTPIKPDDTISITVSYHGHLSGYTETGMAYVKEVLDPDFTIIRNENLSFPIISPADADGLRGTYNYRFSYDIAVTVPNGHIVASGSELTGKTTSEDHTTFKYHQATADSIVLAAIAPYEHIKQSSVDIFHFADDRDGAERLGVAVRRTLDFFENTHGARIQKGRMAIIEIPEDFGSQAIFPTIIQTADAFKETKGLGQAYHEISHLWHPAHTSHRPMRWNEGHAMYIRGLLSERFDQDGAYKTLINRLRQNAKRSLTANEARRIPMIEYGQEGITFLSYSAGGVFFALVDKIIGEEKLHHIMKTVYQKYGKNGIHDEQYFDELSTLSDQRLDTLIQDWIYTSVYVDLILSDLSFNQIAAHYHQ